LVLIGSAGLLFGQLVLEEADLSEPVAPASSSTEEEVELDEEVVRALTRHGSSRTSQAEQKPVPNDHPGRKRFEQVASRLERAPDTVQLVITLRNGTQRNGTSKNQLVDVETSVGILPLLWHEFTRIERREALSTFTLAEGGTLSGRVTLEDVVLVRDDMSTVVVPFSTVRDVRVIPYER